MERINYSSPKHSALYRFIPKAHAGFYFIHKYNGIHVLLSNHLPPNHLKSILRPSKPKDPLKYRRRFFHDHYILLILYIAKRKWKHYSLKTNRTAFNSSYGHFVNSKIRRFLCLSADFIKKLKYSWFEDDALWNFIVYILGYRKSFDCNVVSIRIFEKNHPWCHQYKIYTIWEMQCSLEY